MQQQQQQKGTSRVSVTSGEGGSQLACQENFGSAFPDSIISKAWDVMKENTSGGSASSSRFRTELDPDDVKLVNELGQLSADKLMEYLRNLQTVAVTLGEEESRQFSRAKCLNILGKEN